MQVLPSKIHHFFANYRVNFVHLILYSIRQGEMMGRMTGETKGGMKLTKVFI